DEQLEQPIAPELLVSARRYGWGFPRGIVLVGAALLVACVVSAVGGVWGGANLAVAGGVAVALAFASAVRQQWAAALLAAVLLTALATLVEIPVHDDAPLTVQDAFALGAGTAEPRLSQGTAA